MPELPEVETVRRGLERRVTGRRIGPIEVLNPLVIRGEPDAFRDFLEGRRIGSVRRKGKTLAISLASNGSEAGHLMVRLGMTGQLVVSARHAPILPHTHVRISLGEDGEELRFRDPRRFGMLRCCTACETQRVFGALGPDALEITSRQFQHTLRGRSGAIKGWLLNQRMLSGLGNIYADEALFAARIHPKTPAGALSGTAAQALLLVVRRVLRRAVKLQGTSFRDYVDIEGHPGQFEPRLQAYARTGLPCPRCGVTIRRVVVCGRSSHFCPACQRPGRRGARQAAQ